MLLPRRRPPLRNRIDQGDVPHGSADHATVGVSGQRELLYLAILEVARDIKELKAFLMTDRDSRRSFPVYPTQGAPLDTRATEVEYTETDRPISAIEEIRPIREVERDAIAAALGATGGHRKKAARLLGMPERTLYRKIQHYDLQ